MYVEQGSSSFFILGRFYKYYVIIIQCRTIVDPIIANQDYDFRRIE